MSTLKRLERLAKSMLPRFSGHGGRHYSHSDARLVLTGLGMQMTPETFRFLTETDTVLEDFILCLYALEQKTGKTALTPLMELSEEFHPRVYDEEQEVVITIVWRGKEMILAAYQKP